MIEVPRLHDGYLTAIALADKQATFTAKSVEGERWQIVVRGVQALQVDDFREGNIINCIEVITRAQPPREVMERLFTPPHDNAAAEYHLAHGEFLDQKCEAIRSGEFTLIMITPSYGAEVAALGTSVDFLRPVD